MGYPKFNDIKNIDECDIICLADRLVKEDKYVGLDERIEYILNKAPKTEEVKQRICKSKEITRKFIEDIETVIEKTIDQMFIVQGKLDEILKQVEKPGRYIGGEVNSIKKDHSNLKVKLAFAFPDIYEIGMSYLGMQILYNAVNKEEGLCCERVLRSWDGCHIHQIS